MREVGYALVIEIPPEDLREQYIENGKSFEECAEYFNCSSSLIENRLHEYDIPTRPAGGEPVEISKSELRELYVEKDLSTVEIADRYNCHNSTISSKLNEQGISTEGPNHGNSLNLPKEELIDLYVQQEKTTYELADYYDCDSTVIERRLRWYGITKRHTGPSDDPWEYKYGSSWRRQRRKALERAEYRCELCGMTDDEHRKTHIEPTRGVRFGLDVHHRVSVRLFKRWDLPIDDANQLVNLEVLCQSCHQNFGDRVGTFEVFEE